MTPLPTNAKTVYIVEALRYGDREQHSYVLGVWTTLEAAKAAAQEETEYRGGKYICQVHQCTLDNYMDKDFSATILFQSSD